MFKIIDWVVNAVFSILEGIVKIIIFLLAVGFVVGVIALAIWFF